MIKRDICAAEIKPWTDGASIDTTSKLGTALNSDFDSMLDTAKVADTA